MQVEKHKNTLQLHKQNLLELLSRRLKRAKKPLKSRVLGSKSVQLGMKNFEPTTKLERQNGAKCWLCSQKRTR